MPVRLLAAGSNSHGQLSLGVNAPEDAHRLSEAQFEQAPASVDAIACGATHMLLLGRDSTGKSTIWGVGSNSRGQLRPSSPCSELLTALQPLQDSALPGEVDVRAIATSWETSLVAIAETQAGACDSILVFGSNDWGEHGHDTGSSSISVIELRRSLPQANGISLEALHAGPRCAAALVQAQTPSGRLERHVIAWGAARHGQFGPSMRRLAPTRVDLTGGNQLEPVALSLGSDHAAYLLQDPSGRQQVVIQGSTRRGQFVPDENGTSPPRRVVSFPSQEPSRVLSLGCTWSGVYVLVENAQDGRHILAQGADDHGQLANTRSGDDHWHRIDARSCKHLVCGSEHVLLSDDARVVGWGWNEHGNLADGTTDDVATPTRVYDGAVRPFAGNATTFLLVSDQQAI